MNLRKRKLTKERNQKPKKEPNIWKRADKYEMTQSYHPTACQPPFSEVESPWCRKGVEFVDSFCSPCEFGNRRSDQFSPCALLPRAQRLRWQRYCVVGKYRSQAHLHVRANPVTQTQIRTLFDSQFVLSYRLGCVQMMLATPPASPAKRLSSRINWGTCVVLPHPVIPLITKTWQIVCITELLIEKHQFHNLCSH